MALVSFIDIYLFTLETQLKLINSRFQLVLRNKLEKKKKANDEG